MCANWCNNILTVIPVNVNTTVINEFMEWAEKFENNWECGHVPDGIVVTDSWLFNITSVDEHGFQFESKWACPITTLVQIAKKYRFSFEVEYEELGCGIYGKSKFDFNTGEVWDKHLNEIPEDDEDGLRYDEMDKTLEEMEYKLNENYG